MKRFLSLFVFGIALVGVLTLGSLVDASSIPKPDYQIGPAANQSAEQTQNYILNTTVPRAINIGTGVLSVSAFIGIVVSALQMLLAWGNEDRLTKAKNTFRYSVMGLLVILLSYAIISVILSLSLPTAHFELIPSAYALDVNNASDLLLPNTQDILQSNRVDLPSGDAVTEVFPALVTNLLYLFGFLLFISMLYAGSLLVTGRGNEDSVTKARQIFVYGLIAMALVGAGYALVYGIATLDLSTNVLGVIQLDDSLRPDGLPAFDESIVQSAPDANNPESSVSQSAILFIGALLSQVLLFLGAVGVIILIVAGANYIFAFGKEERIQKGKDGLFWAIMGLLVVLLSYAIVQGFIRLLVLIDVAA